MYTVETKELEKQTSKLECLGIFLTDAVKKSQTSKENSNNGLTRDLQGIVNMYINLLDQISEQKGMPKHIKESLNQRSERYFELLSNMGFYKG